MTRPVTLAPVPDDYVAACDRIDAWRRERLAGLRAVSGSRWTKRGEADEWQLMATEAHGHVATGRGPTREAATVDLARRLPLPAPAPLPTMTSLGEMGLPDMGTEPSCGVTARPMRAEVA